MGLEKINDINQPVIILSEQLEPIMQKYFTKEEYEEFLKYKISIDNGCGLYYTADINRFFLVNFDNDFYLSYKLYKQIAKDNVIE